jgi:hypothetical protein
MVYTLLLYSLDPHRKNDGQRNELILDGLGNQKKLVPPG